MATINELQESYRLAKDLHANILKYNLSGLDTAYAFMKSLEKQIRELEGERH